MRVGLSVILVLMAMLFGQSKVFAQATGGSRAMPFPGQMWRYTPEIYTGADRAYFWSGYSQSRDWWGGWVGGQAKLNGDFSTDGWTVRAGYTEGVDRYWSNSFPITHYKTYAAELLLGYQHKIGEAWVTGWFGGAVEGNPNPDPLASQRGWQGGAKVAGQIWAPLNDKLSGYVSASYSQAFNTAALTASFRYQLTDNISLGPEARYETDSATLEGAAGTYEYRAGGSITYLLPAAEWGRLSITAGGGQEWVIGTGPNGFYLNLGLGVAFK